MIEGAVAGRITVEEAASLLQLSERQVKRLKQRSSDGSGAQWVYHGNRERTPANRTAEAGSDRKGLCKPIHCATDSSFGRNRVAAETPGCQVPVTAGAPGTGRHDGADRCQYS